MSFVGLMVESVLNAIDIESYFRVQWLNQPWNGIDVETYFWV